jgi:hypothetical protein
MGRCEKSSVGSGVPKFRSSEVPKTEVPKFRGSEIDAECEERPTKNLGTQLLRTAELRNPGTDSDSVLSESLTLPSLNIF